jgi:hypothetical protein
MSESWDADARVASDLDSGVRLAAFGFLAAPARSAGFQGARIIVPKASALRPNPDYLAERFELFRNIG